MTEPLKAELLELHAFVDGELTAADEARVRARLEQDADARQRVKDYQDLDIGLQALFALKPEPEISTQRPQRRAFAWKIPLSLAAGFMLLVTGGILGRLLPDWTDINLLEAQPGIVHEAAMAYAVFAPEILHPVEISGKEAAHLASWLSSKLNNKVILPSLEHLGYQLLGGRLISSDDGPGAILMYEDSSGKRIALYLCLDEEQDHPAGLRYAHEDQVSVAYWFQQGLSYGLAAELARQPLQQLSQAIYSQING